MVAASRQAVNKNLKEWENQEIIDLSYGKLIIKNLPALKKSNTWQRITYRKPETRFRQKTIQVHSKTEFIKLKGHLLFCI
jgi:hypothetical protein